MKKQPFLPNDDKGLSLWLNNFAAKLPDYTGKYNITKEEIAAANEAAIAFDQWLDVRRQTDAFSEKITAYKNEIRDGIKAGAKASTLPLAPGIYSMLSAATPVIVALVISLATSIKKKPQYTDADGKDLGLEGAVVAADEKSSIQPVLKVQPGAGGHPDISWRKGNMDSIEIWKDSGHGQWAFLAIDTMPGYSDTAPLPSGGESAVWKYKAIYRKRDVQAGSWSDVVSIAVGM